MSKLYHVNVKYSLEESLAVLADSEEDAKAKAKKRAHTDEAVGCSYSDMTSEITSVQLVGDTED